MIVLKQISKVLKTKLRVDLRKDDIYASKD